MIETLPLWLPGAVAMLAILFVSGFFSGSETALFFLSDDDARSLELGSPADRAAALLLRDPDRLLTAILFWNLVANLLYFAIGVATARRLIAAGEPVLAGLLNLGALVAIILFGEVLPKSVAIARVRTAVQWVARPLAFFVALIDPIRPLLRTLAAAIRRAVYPGILAEPRLEARDIDQAIRSGSGTADRANIDAFARILDLLPQTAEDVMRPRASFRALSIQTGRPLLLAGDVVIRRHPSEVWHEVAAAHHVRPDGSISRDAMRPLDYVPWSTSMAVAFEHLDAADDVAVGVVGEYGELLGVITWDDVVDSLSSEKASRFRRSFREEPISRVAPGRYLVHGMTSLRVLGDFLKLDDASVEPHVGESRTVAGLLQEELDRAGRVGDAMVWNGFRLSIEQQTGPGKFLIGVEPAARTVGDGSDGSGRSSEGLP